MKAYCIETNDPDEGQAIVFAEKPSQAKGQIYGTGMYPPDSWTDIRARRAPGYDGMESASPAELALKQWKEGWQWFDLDYPDPDEDSDETFYEWYRKTFEGGQ